MASRAASAALHLNSIKTNGFSGNGAKANGTATEALPIPRTIAIELPSGETRAR